MNIVIKSRKTYWAIPIVLILIITIFSLSFSFVKNEELHNSLKSINKTSASLVSDVDFANNGDIQKDGKFDGQDVLHFNFTIKNTSNESLKFLTLDTGIPANNIYFVHNISGTTGISTDSKTIKFNNIVLEANRQLSLSFEGSLLSSQKDYSLVVNPKLIKGTTTLISAQSRTYTVAKHDIFKKQTAIATGGVL